MKSIIKLGILVFCVSLFVTACKEHKHGEDTHTHDSPAMEKADMAMNDVYQCPMDCEKGKTYDEAGNCGECGMELKKVEKEAEKEAQSDSDHNHEGHNH